MITQILAKMQWCFAVWLSSKASGSVPMNGKRNCQKRYDRYCQPSISEIAFTNVAGFEPFQPRESAEVEDMPCGRRKHEPRMQYLPNNTLGQIKLASVCQTKLKIVFRCSSSLKLTTKDNDSQIAMIEVIHHLGRENCRKGLN